LRRIPLFALLLCCLASSADAGVFGDGDASNGDEDSRIALASPEWGEQGPGAWSRSAGTVHCDGRNRGTAMVLDTTGLGPQPTGLVLMTAAHVLLDLETARPFEHCQFHYMGLDQLPGYQADIDLGTVARGRFDARSPRDSLAFGREDWAFLYVPGPIPGAAPDGRIRPQAHAVLAADDPAPNYHLIGFSRRDRAMVVSLDCAVVESNAADLGGGAWPGHLLDDCDSGQGASGGGLVASVDGRHFLVGIRTGAHWDEHIYPAQLFPTGPPAGAVWDVRSNTNFSRAVDAALLVSLSAFLEELAGASPLPGNAPRRR
jgi:hypothetical protein